MERSSSARSPLGTVRVEEDPDLARTVQDRSSPPAPFRSLTVSDLLGPRRAVYRWLAPRTPIADERRERMESGRSVHARLDRALRGEGQFEVHLRRGGIAGRIDLWADVPVEVKTGLPVGADHLVDQRPDHVEQIAMYCALTDRRTGRVVTLSPRVDGAWGVEAVDLSIDEPSAVRAAMDRRAEQIRSARRAGNSDGLPGCRWRGRRCEFEEARVCACAETDPPAGTDLLEHVVERTARPDVEDRWRVALGAIAEDRPDPSPYRIRELIYPRRTYYERVAPPPAPPPPAPPTDAPDLYDRLVGAIEGGPTGEVARVFAPAGFSEDEVTGFRGLPYLLKTSRAWARIRPREVDARFPHYSLELGLRCAAADAPDGLVFIAYEHAERDVDRFQALRYRFDDLPELARLGSGRRDGLTDAIARRDPSRLPACPAWMFDGCPYRAQCGCGAEAGRSQR